MKFDHCDIDGFLSDYWQKKPLLIKNPWKSWSNPLEPDELAGLACDDEVESRLITQERDTWNVEQGPLAETRFSRLCKKPWTLLVPAVAHHAPGAAPPNQPFHFLPTRPTTTPI